MAVILLLAAMFIIALVRVHTPFGTKILGRPVATIQLSLRERLLAHRTNLYMIGVVILLGAVGGFLRGPLQMVSLLACFVLVMLPMRYQITSEGIALNNVLYRPWTEFQGVREERTALVLEGAEGAGNLRLHVLGQNRDQARTLVSRIFRGARRQSAMGRGKTAEA